MSDKRLLRKTRAGTVINKTSMKQDVYETREFSYAGLLLLKVARF